MSKTERQRLLQSTKGVTVNLDPDTHRVIKAWAHQEGITIVHAIRLMAAAFFKSQLRKQPEEGKEETAAGISDEVKQVWPHSALGYRPPAPEAKLSLTLT